MASPYQRVVDLMTEATNLLRNEVSNRSPIATRPVGGLEATINLNSSSIVRQDSELGADRTPEGRRTLNVARPTNVLDEMRRNFAPYNRTSASRRLVGQQRERTWTHNYFCFGAPTRRSPSTFERSNLQRQGLGAKTFSVGQSANSATLRNKIVEMFPSLSNINFSLQRASSGGQLKDLYLIIDGQPVPTVLELISSRVGVIYIVPCDVITEEDEGDTSATVHQQIETISDTETASDVNVIQTRNILQQSSSTFDIDDLTTMSDYRDYLYSQNDGVQPIYLQRDDFLLQILGIYKDPTFNIFKKPNVIFIGEPGRDVGALTKEFFHLGFEALYSSSIDGLALFEGQEDHKLPRDDNCLLKSGIYEKVGKFMAHAAIHTSVSLIGLSEVIALYFCDEDDELSFEATIELDDIPDLELRQIVATMQNIRFNSLTSLQVQEIQEACDNAGFYKSITDLNIGVAVDHLITHHVFDRRKDQILSIKKAFRESGLLQFLVKRNYLWRGLFPRSGDLDIPPNIVTNKIEFSGDDQSLFVLTAVKKFILTLPQGKVKDIVKAWTGWPFIPEGSLYLEAITAGTMKVTSCSSKIEIPISMTAGEIKEWMQLIIVYGSAGFGTI